MVIVDCDEAKVNPMTDTKDSSTTHADEFEKTPLIEKSYAVEKVINFQSLVLFSTFLSTTYQSTLLYLLSPPLTSYITLGDALLKIAIAVPFMGSGVFLLVDFIEDFSARLQNGEPFKGSKAHQIANGLSYFGSAIIVIMIGMSLHKTPLSAMTFDSLTTHANNIGKVAVLIVILRVLVRALWHVSIIRHNAETSGSIVERDIGSIFILGVGCAMTLGSLSAIFKNPDYCEIKTTNAVQEAYFLAALQNVTALEVGGQTIIMSNSQIEQINCDIPRPSNDDDTPGVRQLIA